MHGRARGVPLWGEQICEHTIRPEAGHAGSARGLEGREFDSIASRHVLMVTALYTIDGYNPSPAARARLAPHSSISRS